MVIPGHPVNNARTDPPGNRRDGSAVWTLAVFLAVSPLVFALCLDLWRMPVPLSEGVALLEDVARPPASRFLAAETSYYRPLFQLTLAAIWNNDASLDVRLAWIRAAHIIPIAALFFLFIWHLRPRSAVDAAAATVACAVLIGSPGFRDNLEIPLNYTIVGMPLALGVWMLLNRDSRRWSGVAIIGLTLIAIGFKEQGLVIVPVALAAWWMGAPGARRGVVAGLVLIAVAYVLFRLQWRQNWPAFEQAIGLGFREMDATEAIARFAAFPYWMYAYNAGSTIANILFSEPTRGVFTILRSITEDRLQPWQLNHLLSSAAMTTAIVWWAVGAMKRGDDSWSFEGRAVLVLVVAVLACGALGFNYSRDRLGGMALVFYALASFLALRALIGRAARWNRVRFAAAATGLLLLAGGWQLRALGTVEYVRLTSLRNQLEWWVDLHERRRDLASRPTYLRIMDELIPQGVTPDAPEPTPLPPGVTHLMGWP